jgi:transcription-repair coupling factor (superfamily II helicase)
MISSVDDSMENISLAGLSSKIASRTSGIECTGLGGSAARAYFVSNVYYEQRVPLVVVVPSSREAERFAEDLRFFLAAPAPAVLYFPAYNLLPYKHLAYHSETAARRIRTLYRMMAEETAFILVTTPDALLQRLVPKQELAEYAELVMAGEEIDRDLLIEKLVSGGYERTMIVEEPGDFCVRGGILDVFCPLYPEPMRMELFGDVVDDLRFFSPASQRKTGAVMDATILPAREAILKKERLREIVGRVRILASDLGMPVTKVRELVDHIKKDGIFSGIESLISLIYPRLDTFFDYVSEESLFVLVEPAQLKAAAHESWEKMFKNFSTAKSESRLCVPPEDLYMGWPEAHERLEKRAPIALKQLAVGSPSGESVPTRYEFDWRDNSHMQSELKRVRERENLLLPLVNWIAENRRSGSMTVLVCNTNAQIQRLESLLSPYGIRPMPVDHFPEVSRGKGLVYACIGQVSAGFVWDSESLAVITENEIFSERPKRRRSERRNIATELLAVEDLKVEDLVVHIEHGIGRYEGLIKLNLNGATGDFLVIVYRDDDKLYLPMDRMSMVQKYMGVESLVPILDKMGGKSWERIKAKVKRSVEKIAGKLLSLYANRKVKKGHPYVAVDSYFTDFEADFAYEETSDQLKAIDDVFNDMQSTVPMDRLVCGDVGYGKTEVALRASFVAINDNKQVAVLVPTTILAEQHFATFRDRFARYPVQVECLSRFRTAREQRRIVNDLKEGRADIVIGTHRLLQKDVVFKDIGLVVVDEEQRFGVTHKEKLKQFRQTVDVLALTATPIPRTLHMSLMGVRDISIISTPPEDRQAIITYISEYDEVVIFEAVTRELERGGQIFFVHNNIHSIYRMTERLKELIPEARIDVAHGRMEANELEHVMLQFMKKEIDMLVCTTIIESGLDIPAANTLIVNRADRFGLAQMYQLRGRVGRSDEQAYAYLFIPGESLLSKDARKRLKVLMEHSDLGSGFQIAMSDLKIRGGGTILGASQSGHIAAVGYDMFLKLMEQSIAELKGESVQENLEPEINITISAFIPESYISNIDQRLSTYRRLARMKTVLDIADIKVELMDRFGPLPEETTNLLLKIMLKVLAIQAGVKRLDLHDQMLLLHFSEAHQKNSFGIVDMIMDQRDCYQFTPEHVFKARLSGTSPAANLAQVKNILKEITNRVNR